MGDINSVWPLLCAADDDSVPDTCAFEAIWLLNVTGRFSVDPFLDETAAGVTRKERRKKRKGGGDSDARMWCKKDAEVRKY